jgi:hypothetical protein
MMTVDKITHKQECPKCDREETMRDNIEHRGEILRETRLCLHHDCNNEYIIKSYTEIVDVFTVE